MPEKKEGLIKSMLPGVVQGGLAMLTGIGADKRQQKQQDKLNENAAKHNKDLAKYSSDLQYEMWKKTNYPAQVEMMEAAGLNPGLMYGMSGGGGTTTGSANAGTLSGGQAANAAQTQGMGLQTALIGAQIKLMEAQAEKAKTESEKIGGVDTAKTATEIESLTQGIANQKQQEQLQKAQTRLSGLQGDLAEGTLEATIERVVYETDRAASEMQIAWNEAFVSRGTRESKVEIARQEAIYGGLKNILTKAQTDSTLKGIEVNDAQIKKMAADIAQGWKGLDQGEYENATKRFKAEIEANYPGLLNVVGRGIDDFVDSIFNLGGGRIQHKGAKNY